MLPPKLVLTALFGLLSLYLLYLHSSYQTQLDQQAYTLRFQLARPIQGRFPTWYGNPAQVGNSPWDYQLAGHGDGRKKRVLFLTGTFCLSLFPRLKLTVRRLSYRLYRYDRFLTQSRTDCHSNPMCCLFYFRLPR